MVTGSHTVTVYLSDERMAEIRAIVPGFEAVRQLHKPDPSDDFGDTAWCGQCAWTYDGSTWPCSTARLVYTEVEIAALTTAP